MPLLVGLGNPGSRYADTRHNFGFWVLDDLAKFLDISFAPGRGDYLVGRKGGDETILLKPTSFMNDSGSPLREAMSFFKVEAKDVMVVFDDIDLPLGTIRFRPTGGAGGHRGVESIIQQLGTEDFSRLRLGIASDARMRPSEKYVLRAFRKKDLPLVNEVRQNSVDGIKYFLKHGMEQTMTRFNTKPQVP